MMKTLVVVVDGDREHLLCMALANHIIVEKPTDFLRVRNAVPRFGQRGLVLLLDDVLAAAATGYVADEHGRSGDGLCAPPVALPQNEQ